MPLPAEITGPIFSFLSTYKWVIIFVLGCLVVGYGSVIFFGKNNPVEIDAEKVIDVETGLNVNLTP